MFLGLAVLCRAPASKYKWMNYLHLDYKSYYTSMPSLPDVVETVPEYMSKKINILTETLKELPLKMRVKPLRNINSDFKWKIEFIYKGKSYVGFYLDYDFFLVCIYFNDSKNITAMAASLKDEPDLFEWYCNHIPERLCKCPNNRWVTLGGTRRRICGMSDRLDVKEPDEADLKNCIMILRRFHDI